MVKKMARLLSPSAAARVLGSGGLENVLHRVVSPR
jgi:hypothetical protein